MPTELIVTDTNFSILYPYFTFWFSSIAFWIVSAVLSLCALGLIWVSFVKFSPKDSGFRRIGFLALGFGFLAVFFGSLGKLSGESKPASFLIGNKSQYSWKDASGKTLWEGNLSEFSYIEVNITSEANSSKKSTSRKIKYRFSLPFFPGFSLPITESSFSEKNNTPEPHKRVEILENFTKKWSPFFPVPLVDSSTGWKIDPKTAKILPNSEMVPTNLNLENLESKLEPILKPYQFGKNNFRILKDTSLNFTFSLALCSCFFFALVCLDLLFLGDFDSKGERFIFGFLLLFPSLLGFKSYSEFQTEGTWEIRQNTLNFEIVDLNLPEKPKISIPLSQNPICSVDWLSQGIPLVCLPESQFQLIQKRNLELHRKVLSQESINSFFEATTELGSDASSLFVAAQSIQSFPLRSTQLTKMEMVALLLYIQNKPNR